MPPNARFVHLLALLVSVGGLAWPATALGAPDATSPRSLAELVWQRNPDVRQARSAEGQAEAELVRAHQLKNPTMTFGSASVPLGPEVINYPHETSNAPLPFGYGPNYNLSVSQPYEFGSKRELRVERAAIGQKRARSQTLELYTQRTADLGAALVKLCASELHAGLLKRQQAAVAELLRVARLSAREGYIAPLEAEKLELELGRLQTLGDDARLAQEAARLEWSRLVLEPAPRFDEAAAEATLARWTRLPSAWPDTGAALAALPARRTLEADAATARVDGTLSERMRIPDAAFALGYTFDTLPGNPRHYLGASVQLDLPVFQAGQAEGRDAASRLAVANEALDSQERLVAQQAAGLRERATGLRHMVDQLRTQRLSAARATLDRFQVALKARGIPLTDVIQARRTLLDLEEEQLNLLEQLGVTLTDYQRLLGWNVPEPEGGAP